MDLELSDDSRKVIEDIFRSKDINGNGVFDKKELRQCLIVIGLCPTDEHLNFLYKQFDKNGDGQLQINEIMANLDTLNVHSVKGDELMEAFKKIDKSGDGFLCERELIAIMTMQGEGSMTKEDAQTLVKEILQEFDTDHDGKMNYSEFVKMFMSSGITF